MLPNMNKFDFMENLIYLFMLVHPATTADRIYNYWEKDKVLQEYPKPKKAELHAVVTRIKAEITQITL